MKKLYLSICVLFISFSSFAQITNLGLTVATRGEKSNLDITLSNEKSTPVWSEDFSNGIPTTWTTNSMASWVYRGPSTTPNVTIGSQGAYMTNQTPIASTTAQNGFIIFDSDYYDNLGIQGNFGGGA